MPIFIGRGAPVCCSEGPPAYAPSGRAPTVTSGGRGSRPKISKTTPCKVAGGRRNRRVEPVLDTSRLGKNSLASRTRRRQFSLVARAELVAESFAQFGRRPAKKILLLRRANEFLPSLVGQICVESPLQKYFYFHPPQITSRAPGIPSHKRGVSRSSRTRDGDAVDAAALGAQRGCRAGWRKACERSNGERTNDVAAYGEVVWS